MKKNVILGLLLAICGGLVAANKIDTNYDMPAFSGEYAFAVDANALNGQFAAVEVANYSKFKNLDFEVYVHSPLTQKWEDLGNVKLPGFDALLQVGKKFPKIGSYRYFVLVAKSQKEDYQFKAEKANKKLTIGIYTKGVDMDIRPVPYHSGTGVYVVAKDQLSEDARDAEDNVRFINNTSVPSVSVAVFAWNAAEYKWVKLGNVTAEKDQKKASKLKLENGIEGIKYFAILPTDGAKYDYRFRGDHGDFNIIVEDYVAEVE